MTKKERFSVVRSLSVLSVAAALVLALAWGQAFATEPVLGGSKTTESGGAGGAASQGASSQLEHCDETMGTMAIEEDQGAAWYGQLSQYKLGSTIPVLRLLVQQSNCFVVVERGSAMRNIMGERQLQQSGEMREGSSFGKGQIAAADYTMSPSITFSQKGTSGLGGALGAVGGVLGKAAGAIAGGMKTNEASTVLLLIDNRSSVQLAAATGSAKNMDFSLFGGMFGGGAGGAAGGYTNTPEGKILTAAFMDSYNQLVKVVRNYKAQNVKGGLGTGGRLGVQGGQTPASKGNR